jgi:hypothetical protein
MASKKTLKHLRDKSETELRSRERDLREQLFKLRFSARPDRWKTDEDAPGPPRDRADRTLLNQRAKSA